MSESDKQYLDRLENGNEAQRACLMIMESVLDAPHHGLWYLDQALRILAGDEYGRMIDAFERLSGGEPWDAGIVP